MANLSRASPAGEVSQSCLTFKLSGISQAFVEFMDCVRVILLVRSSNIFGNDVKKTRYRTRVGKLEVRDYRKLLTENKFGLSLAFD